MADPGQAILVVTNMPDAETAHAVAHRAVEGRLAACVNCLPQVRSVYRWQGVIEEASEMTLLIKTTQERYAQLEALIVNLHPYDVPEIIAIPISAGLPAYLQWIAQETRTNETH